MTKYEKPIYAQMPNFQYSSMIVAPIKPGTRIRVVKQKPFAISRYEQSVVGTLEYRDWIGRDESAPYRLDAGVRYGPHLDEWEVILVDDRWELLD